MKNLRLLFALLAAWTLPHWSWAQRSGQTIVSSEYIANPMPTPSCHASTLVESMDVLIAAWFGGSDEGNLDVSIWLSRNEGNGWSAPVEVANGQNDEERVRYPLWNPVLFRPKDGPLTLFYKEGPSPENWWGMMKTSKDNGRTWSRAKRLPDGILGPIKNKPIQLPDGTILSGSSTEDNGWRVHMERTKNFKEWTKTDSINRSIDFGAIQPTILEHNDGVLQILARTKQDAIAEAWSSDWGKTWGRMTKTDLPNPNSGIDGLRLRDGRQLLVYNHTTQGRGVLNVAISTDGKKWSAVAVLENSPGSEFSYPAVIQTADRMVHVTYTWNRRMIKHLVLDPSAFAPKPMPNGRWPN
ncbi:MAG: sialidase family protein [Verrucomicrobiota bacterium]|nr:sialidase family protein [Verrucomicrobiota bacterium]